MSSTNTLNTVIPRLTAIVNGHKDLLNKMKQQDNNRKSLQNSAENALRPAATEKNERERESTLVKSSKMRWSAAIARALWSSCCVNVSSFFPQQDEVANGVLWHGAWWDLCPPRRSTKWTLTLAGCMPTHRKRWLTPPMMMQVKRARRSLRRMMTPKSKKMREQCIRGRP